MSPRFAILIITLIINGLLLVSVYKSNPRKTANRVFALLCFIASLWFVVMYASVQPALLDYSLELIRTTVFLAAPMTLLFFLLARVIPDEEL